jgi:hypothetical protein
MDEIRAPWTPRQVLALNRFQQDGRYHPFTCGNPHPVAQVLWALADGWYCPDIRCGYRQNWAHAFMAELDEPVQPLTEGVLAARIAGELLRTPTDGTVQALAAVAARVVREAGLLGPGE